MSALSNIRAAADVAREDLNVCSGELRMRILAIKDGTMRELMARVSANIHELDLLHRRELAIIAGGKEPEVEARTVNDEECSMGGPAKS